MDHCPDHKNRALLFMLIFWVQRGQRSVWHAEYNKAGGSVSLISLCEAGSQQICRQNWPFWSLRLSTAKPNPRHTKLVTVTNTGGIDNLQFQTAWHSRSKSPLSEVRAEVKLWHSPRTTLGELWQFPTFWLMYQSVQRSCFLCRSVSTLLLVSSRDYWSHVIVRRCFV